jgi:hypothetical protein
MPVMKKTAAIFLLCVYVLIQVVAVCWHFYQPLAHAFFLNQLNHDPKGEPAQLLSITIDHTALDSLKNEDDEIVINGILYDVERSVSCGTTMKLFLKKDADETDWNIHYKKITSLLYKHSGNRHTTAGKIPVIMFPLFCCRETTACTRMVKFLRKMPKPTVTHFLSAPVKDLVTPPPRLC